MPGEPLEKVLRCSHAVALVRAAVERTGASADESLYAQLKSFFSTAEDTNISFPGINDMADIVPAMSAQLENASKSEVEQMLGMIQV